MQRRRFLTTAVAAAVGLAWPRATTAAARRRAAAALASPRSLAVLGDQTLVRELGRRYRALVPAEDDAGSLAQALLPARDLDARDDLQSWIADQVRRDFSDERTVTVHGWILSVTEARQCALCSLHPV